MNRNVLMTEDELDNDNISVVELSADLITESFANFALTICVLHMMKEPEFSSLLNKLVELDPNQWAVLSGTLDNLLADIA